MVVPAHDEAPNLVRLLAAVRAALDPTGLAWELIVVDDGSTDDTPEILARLAAIDARLRPLRLPVRSGQTAALLAGFAVAAGARIATLDADLQCTPDDLPGLLAALDDGADLACGVRARRQDPLSRRVASALSNLARRLVLAPRVRDLACPLRVFDASALARMRAAIPLFDGAHRWLPALFGLAGLRVAQRPVAHLPRQAGRSKYTTSGRLGPIAHEVGEVLRVMLARSAGARIAVGLGLVALSTLPFLYALGTWPLIEPDEGRNAEVAREMLLLGSYSVPHFNLLPYLDKPVLLFWMIAAAFRAVGVSELGARLPAAVAGVATVVLTFLIGQALLDRRRALLAALIVGTAPMVVIFGRLAIFDMPFTALVTAALACLVQARRDGRAACWLPLAGLAIGLAVLTKGPVGIAVPLLAWLAARGALPAAPRRTGSLPVLAAASVTLAVVLPWLALVARQEPAFLRYAFVDETVLRFFSPGRFHRSGSVFYYAGMLTWALGAWGIVLAALIPTLIRRRRAGGADAAAIAFAARATAAILLFFTCSASKRPQYILPAMVPLSLLLSAGFAAEATRAAAVVRFCARFVVVPVGIATLGAALAGTTYTHGDFRVITPSLLFAIAAFLLVWGVATGIAARRPALAVVCCALFAPVLGATLLGPLTPYAEGRSSRNLAARIAPQDRVVAFEAFRTALPFYLRRQVTLVSDTAHELTSNYVTSQRAQLFGRDGLLPVDRLPEVVDPAAPSYLLTSTWRVDRLTRLSPYPLERVYTERREILLRPAG